jgi:predicted nuclease of predicted toxin-antitoxin system
VAYLEKEGLYAEHVRDVLGQGADGETDILPYAIDHDLILVTSDVSDFGRLSAETHAGIMLLHADTMPAYRVASNLIAMVDAYSSRSAYGGRDTLHACS